MRDICMLRIHQKLTSFEFRCSQRSRGGGRPADEPKALLDVLMSNDRHLRDEGSGVKGSPTRARSSGNMCDMADWGDCTILICYIGMRPRYGIDCAYREIGEIAASGLCRKLL